MVFLMTDDKEILIKNIYYMLTYAFQVLKKSNYDEIAAESFDNIQDLFAAILAKGTAQQLKQGLYREYIGQYKNMTVMRGKLDIQGTIHNKLQRKQQLCCEFDDLSVNNIFNQILKTTITILICEKSVKIKHKNELKKIMLFFDNIDVIDPTAIRWNMLCFQRNNQNYQMLMNICYFILDGLLQTTEKGSYKMTSFSDEHMARLYEKFVLEYYRYHHGYLSEIKAAQIKWNLSGEVDENLIKFLPIMQTDIMLRYHEKILIIDAKYYKNTMQSRFESHTLHSNNLYQIFTYVKNMDIESTGNVLGLLLYAKTDEEITPDCEYLMSSNRIIIKTLDLNKEFKQIARRLDEIVQLYLQVPDRAN